MVSLDAYMIGYERILFYSTKLPQEMENNEIEPKNDWPDEGKVKKIFFRFIKINYYFYNYL
jgi:hypothetical protein